MRMIIAVLVLANVACEQAEQVSQQSKAALERGQASLDRIAEKTDALEPGQLSARAKHLLATAEDSKSSIATLISEGIAKGRHLAPAAQAIAAALDQAVGGDTTIEPIYQPIDAGDAETEAVDAAIAEIPHVEVIDGVKVGIRRLDGIEGGVSTRERAYLLAWRRGDHLVGLVYRARRSIDYAALVSDAPRLVRLTQASLARLP